MNRLKSCNINQIKKEKQNIIIEPNENAFLITNLNINDIFKDKVKINDKS